jgi:hypothetical protein
LASELKVFERRFEDEAVKTVGKGVGLEKMGEQWACEKS